jgi:very-short-patch-repair endonuclease
MKDKNSPSHRIYDIKMKLRAKQNRVNATDAEKLMWKGLRDKFREFKFRRQYSIENRYIVDFLCLERRLIIEIDGGQHNENDKDLERTKFLEGLGFKVIRFWNNEVLVNLDICLRVVFEEMEKRKLVIFGNNDNIKVSSPLAGEVISQSEIR